MPLDVWRTNIQFPLMQRKVRVLVTLLVFISTIFGFLGFCSFHNYEPWHIQLGKALGRTLEVHSGLWLATLEVQSRWRYLVALLLLPSGVGAYLLLWNYSLLTVVAAAVGLCWLLYKVVRGERFDAQSI
jgi:hypothetical protein